jgi:hypothetical protein
MVAKLSQFSGHLSHLQKSRRYLEHLVMGSGSTDIVIDYAFDPDSVFQFVCR